MRYLLIACIIGCSAPSLSAQLTAQKNVPTRADTVRGTYNTYRDWWNLMHYDLYVYPDAYAKTIHGSNEITFKVLRGGKHTLQLDLQKPLELDSVLLDGEKLPFERLEQAYLIPMPGQYKTGDEKKLKAYFHGTPRVAVNPPWDGGLIWTRDDLGNPWISVACQGLGASVWWPCKDHGEDEPDNGITFSVYVPANLVGVSNGTLKQTLPGYNHTTYVWEVKAPINNYNVTMNVGKYKSFEDTYKGLGGDLKMQFWFLEQHNDIAKKHLLAEAKEMLESFEYWFGPYPFYEDGFKLIETPFLGMEHQSGIAYGNKFKKGYLGTDLSGSGWGLKWDYILIHESGHEWFGNSISTKDVADMWVHEGFTTYSEVLYVESRYGKPAANAYAQGLRRNIENDRPLIGVYGVNREGSGDMYYKGVQLIHTYRQIVNDDNTFRDMLLEMNKRFYRKVTTTQEVEDLMQEYTGVDLKGFFNTYLRTTKVPKLQYEWKKTPNGNRLSLRFVQVEKGFSIPVNITVDTIDYRITVGEEWVLTDIRSGSKSPTLIVDSNYYLTVGNK